MVPSTVLSSMLLLLLVFSLHMREALGAQTEIRKLKETIKMRRNLEGNNDDRSSKMQTPASSTKRCSGKTFKNMANAYPGGYSSSLCSPCSSSSSHCYTIRCTTTRRCQSVNGSPMTCTTSESCERIGL